MSTANKTEQLKELVIDQNIRVHAEEAPIYDKIHPQMFNWYHAGKSRRDIEYIFDTLATTPELQILDLGCGTGYLALKALSYDGAMVTGVDISQEMLCVLRQKIDQSPNKKDVSLIQQEVVSFLRSDARQYDLIMTSAFLHHLVDIQELLELALKHLKPAGILYIAYEPLKQKIDSRFKFMLHRIVRMLDTLLFKMRMELSGISLPERHENSMADYQTLQGGIDPGDIMSYLEGRGKILKFVRFAARANGFIAFVADKVIRSQNTFSIIFKKL